MTRTRMALLVSSIGLAGVLGLAGCGAASTGAAAGAASTGAAAGVAGTGLADEATALQQVGFDTGLQDTPDPSVSASTAAGAKPAAKRAARRQAIRRYLRKNTLHGEVTVQGKDGVKTIVVQRGSVTSVSGTSLTVKSTDGYSLTWTLADSTVVQDKKKVATSALKAGEQVGVAGTKDGSADDALLIAVK